MDSRFEIREGSVSDLPEIAALEAICFELDPWSLSSFEEAMNVGDCKIYTVYDMQLSKIIGYSVIISVCDQADLANIAVSPSVRKMGIGASLLGYTLEKAACDGVSEVFLEVRASNAAAIALYEKMNFVKIGTRKNYYRHPKEDAIIMVCKIG